MKTPKVKVSAKDHDDSQDTSHMRSVHWEDGELERGKGTTNGTGEDGKKVRTRSSSIRYRLGVAIFEDNGYILKPSTAGLFAGHRLFKIHYPEHQLGLLNYPSKFWYHREVTDDQCMTALDKIMETEIFDNGEDLYNFWLPLTHFTMDKRKPLHAAAKFQLDAKAKDLSKNNKYRYDDVNLFPAKVNGGMHYIPEKSWFNPKLDQVKASDLLTLLPVAEQIVFMLMLGRISVGRNHSQTVDGGTIDHTFRAFAILVGRDPGMGKSRMMSYIIAGLNMCGYDIANVKNINSRFGWGAIAESNLAYIDDFTKASQKAFISNQLTKQLVTNGVVSVETKNVDSIDIESRTVMIGCSNSFNQRDFYDCDSGILSRAQFLHTHSQSDLDEIGEYLSPNFENEDKKPREHWAAIGEQLGIEDPNEAYTTLALWLLRLSQDFFLETCGYERNEDQHKYIKTGGDHLEAVIKTVENLLVLQSKPNQADSLYNGIILGECLAKLADKQFKDQILAGNFKRQINKTPLTTDRLYMGLSGLNQASCTDDSIYDELLKNHPLLTYLKINGSEFTTLDLLLNEVQNKLNNLPPTQDNTIYHGVLLDYYVNYQDGDKIHEFFDKVVYGLILRIVTSTYINNKEKVSDLKLLASCGNYILSSFTELNFASIQSALALTSKSRAFGVSERDGYKMLLSNILDSTGFSSTSDPAWVAYNYQAAQSRFFHDKYNQALLTKLVNNPDCIKHYRDVNQQYNHQFETVATKRVINSKVASRKIYPMEIVH
jgi:hypothetical protein